MSDSLDSAVSDVREAIENDTFDFSTTAVSADEYFSFLETVQDLDFVEAVRHSKVMNEVSLLIADDYAGPVTSELFPEGVWIRQAGMREVTVDGDEQEAMEVELRTTRYFCQPEDEDEYFPGTYDEEAMAFLAAELDYFEEVADVAVLQDDETDEVLVEATLADESVTTFLFDELLTPLPYKIHAVEVDGHALQRVWFAFSETREWSAAAMTHHQQDKLRAYEKARVDGTDPVEFPCGHTGTPTIAMVSDIREDMYSAFPTVTVDEFECYEVTVEDGSSVALDVAEFPDEVDPVDIDGDAVATAISRGYVCDTCDIFYPFVDEQAVRDQVTGDSPELAADTVEVGIGEDADTANYYTFVQFPLAARPIGYRDQWEE